MEKSTNLGSRYFETFPHLGLSLHVLGVPDHLVLRPALDGLRLAGGSLASSSSSVLRGAQEGQREQEQDLQVLGVRVSPSGVVHQPK